MTPKLILAGILAVAVLLGVARLWRWQAKAAPEAKAPGWRLAILIGAQPLAASLLYLTLFPPAVHVAAGSLTVATRGASLGPAPSGHIVALPEASVAPNVERVPDLGTALRRYPGVGEVRVVGEGLPSRDRDALGDRALSFEPGAAPRGIVRLDLPPRSAPGAAFTVAGRIAGYDGGTVELLDPTGRVASRQVITAGDFTLRGAARAPGVALFALRLRDAGGDVVERASVPVIIADEAASRILLLAGAPGPEPKFLRRWAADAGLTLQAQYPTGGGMAIGDTPVAINGSTLARFDLAILDERSWALLGAGERGALIAAVRGGLGLVLRVTGPAPDAIRRQWQALGVTVSGGTEVAPVRLAAGEAAVTRRVVRVAGGDVLPLLRDAGGVPVAHWRQEGRGRVAVWPLTDSFTLALGTAHTRYAEVWSDALAVLARARPIVLPRLDGVARVGERVVICALPADADVLLPSGDSARLLVERRAGCAALWPREAGWHAVQLPKAEPWPFYVNGADALPGVRATEARHATLGLVAAGAAAREGAQESRPGASWPWFLAWLAFSSLTWWFERRRVAVAPQA